MKIGIKVIGNKPKINQHGWTEAFATTLDNAEKEGHRLFKQSFSGFKSHNPGYTKRKVQDGGDTKIEFGVLEPNRDNRIYSHVNWGTAPRPIQANTARGMEFRGSYAPATSKGTLSGGKWRKFGPWQVKYIVMHPGIKARRFDEVIHMMMTNFMPQESKSMLARQQGKTWRK